MALAWCFEDEADPYSDRVLEMLQAEEAVVPAIWPFEIANMLLASERRGRQSADQTAAFIGLLLALPISIDDPSPAILWGSALIVGRDHSLSAYDAAYLELASRRGAALASRDRRLCLAARDHGVRVLAPG